MKSTQKLSVRETFVREMEAKILSGELKPGERLPTSRELCATLGVSLTIVNAGIAELQNKGFVTVKPRHGVYVEDYRVTGGPAMLQAVLQYNGGRLNAHDVRSFCETRMATDPLVAELVIRRAGTGEIEDWAALLGPLEAEPDDERFCVRITEFFDRFYYLSDNSILSMLYHCTMEPQQRMYQMFIEKNGRGYVLQNAVEIIAHVRARDSEAAARCLRETMRLPVEGETAII